MKTPSNLSTLDCIRQRKTAKIMASHALPTKHFNHELIETLIESAYYAPYHYPCDRSFQENTPSPLPWRFYVLSSQTCRQLSRSISEKTANLGKIPAMLNCADYLIQATWCPHPIKSDDNLANQAQFAGNLINMENIAATGAAIQNLLLTATALGYENYWSSGGALRLPEIHKKLGIDSAEILLGSLFIFPLASEIPDITSHQFGKHRNNRGEINNSYQIVTL